jgi:hypothetical protein
MIMIRFPPLQAQRRNEQLSAITVAILNRQLLTLVMPKN